MPINGNLLEGQSLGCRVCRGTTDIDQNDIVDLDVRISRGKKKRRKKSKGKVRRKAQREIAGLHDEKNRNSGQKIIDTYA